MAEFIELILIMAILAMVFGARRSGRLGAAIGRALQRNPRGKDGAPAGPAKNSREVRAAPAGGKDGQQ